VIPTFILNQGNYQSSIVETTGNILIKACKKGGIIAKKMVCVVVWLCKQI